MRLYGAYIHPRMRFDILDYMVFNSRFYYLQKRAFRHFGDDKWSFT